MYIIYYRVGNNGNNKGDYINAHHDKTTTFIKDSPFVLYNHLSEGRPRTFAFLKSTTIQEFKMQDNELIYVPFEANKAVKHALKEEKQWDGFRASIVARCISDKIIVKPAESLEVNYLNNLDPRGNLITPVEQRRSPINYQVSVEKKFIHAKYLIEEREQRENVFFWSSKYAEDGDMKKLDALFETPAGAKYAKQEKGYKGVYKRAICMFHMAKNEYEMQKHLII